MKQNIPCLEEVLTNMVENGVLTITADNQLAKHGTILLTVYPDDGCSVGQELTEIDSVLIDGFPAQIEFEQSNYGISTYNRTLIYVREDMSAMLIDGSETSEKPLKKGIKHLRQQFLDFADERAHEEKQTALDSTGDTTDTTLLKKYAESQSPDKMFEGPYGDTIIEIYMIGLYEYALYFDGGVYEAYKCSTSSPTMEEQLKESDYWQRNQPQGSQTLSVV